MKTERWHITAISRLTGKREPITPELSVATAWETFAKKFPHGKARRGAAWLKPKVERVRPKELEFEFEPCQQ